MFKEKRWPAYLLIAFMIAVVLPTFIQRPDRTDLHILVQAAHRLWAGQPVYLLEDANEHTKPPLATVAFLPLSFLPLFWLSRLWDVLNVVCFFSLLGILLSQAEIKKDRLFGVALGATFLILTPLNSELRLGQYNLILLWAMLACTFRGRSFLAGSALALAVLFKPTFILMSPWVFRQSKRPFHTFAGGTLLVGLLVLSYSGLFGWTAFIRDCRTWVEFLPQSSAKHLLRPDNHGLPSLLGGGVSEKLLLLVAIVLCGWAAVARANALAGLSVACVCMIVFSPMAWLQNYTLLLPGAIWVFSQFPEASERSQKLLKLAFFVLWLGIGAVNPTTCDWLSCTTWTWQRLPLTTLLISLALLLSERCLSTSGTKR